MVAGPRVERGIKDYESFVIPFHQPAIYLAFKFIVSKDYEKLHNHKYNKGEKYVNLYKLLKTFNRKTN